MVMFTTKDTNDTVCVHFTWPVQTGYTPPQGLTLTHRPVFVCRQHHRLYTTIEYWWCGRKFKKSKWWWCLQPKTQMTQSMCISPGQSKLGIHLPRDSRWPTGRSLSVDNSIVYTVTLNIDDVGENLKKWKWWWCLQPKTQMTQSVCISPGQSKLGIHPPPPPPQGFTLTHRLVFVCRQHHRLNL